MSSQKYCRVSPPEGQKVQGSKKNILPEHLESKAPVCHEAGFVAPSCATAGGDGLACWDSTALMHLIKRCADVHERIWENCAPPPSRYEFLQQMNFAPSNSVFPPGQILPRRSCCCHSLVVTLCNTGFAGTEHSSVTNQRNRSSKSTRKTSAND